MDFLSLLEHHLLDHTITVIKVGSWSIPITKHLCLMWGACVVLIGGLGVAARSWTMVPSGPGKNLLEAYVGFIRDHIVVPNVGEDHAYDYLPYFLSLFAFIATVNLIGLLPHSATATGNISVTAALALATFTLINVAGVRQYGFVHHIKNFVPHGVPLWLFPLLLPLELIGLVTKTFALTVRLFANMTAGHVVILAFLSLIFIFDKAIGFVPMTVIGISFSLGMYLFEVFVSLLQAYIFTLLSSIFVGQVLHPH